MQKELVVQVILANDDINILENHDFNNQVFTNEGGNVLHFLAEQSSKQLTEEQIKKCVEIGEFVIQKLEIVSVVKSDLQNFIDFQDNLGNTALHLSVHASNANFVHFLIKHGANVYHMDDLQHGKQAVFGNIAATASLLQYAETHKIVNAENKTALDLATERLLELKQNNKPQAGTAAEAIEQSSELFMLPAPHEFVHKTRFSLRTAYMVGLVARMAYKGHGSDDTDEKEEEYQNEMAHAFLERWGFTQTKIL